PQPSAPPQRNFDTQRRGGNAGRPAPPARDMNRPRPPRHSGNRNDRRDHYRPYRGPRFYGGPDYIEPFGGYYEAPPVYRPRVIRLSRAHINWCKNRYRSYRVSDNSWQPN